MMSFWKRFSYNRGAVIGLVILIVIIKAISGESALR